MLALAGCSGGHESTPNTGTSTAVQPSPDAPPGVAERGTIVFCTDLTYPPLESYDEEGDPVGADVDIGTEIARRFGVAVKFRSTRLEVIIHDVLAGKCDAAISGLTLASRPSIAFVRYLRLGKALLVRRGTPRLTALSELGGRRVGVEAGSVDRDYLRAASARLATPIEIRTYVDNATAARALRRRRIDAVFADLPVVARLVEHSRRTFAIGGPQVDARPAGIAVLHADVSLRLALAREIAAMYRDGTMRRILRRWNLTDAAAATR